ncbi:hypothetical protein V1517DRAFT_353302 [Lipomyces orientalis]|uniref:Uncharacterized protein n=1 Tax=Lipomyces orientalis TaxID=1233043 RepID=A0ACC3TMB2_9ASCO
MSQSLHFAKKLSLLYPWISTPLIVSAPMRVMSGPALAVAISRAGGLGASCLIQKSSTSSSAFHSLSPANPPLPVGRFKPCAAWLYVPRQGQKDFDYWSDRIRDASPCTQIWIQIGTIAEAEGLLKGSERPEGSRSWAMAVVDALTRSQIPLFAAGGIADGRGATAALCLGASGIVMGTRFLAAEEARIGHGYQREILRARDGAGYSPRTIINKSFVEYQAGRPFKELKELHDQALKAGDSGWGPGGRLATYAGASIGLIHEVKKAATIVYDIRKEVLERLSLLQEI